ncbi:MAG: RagB/SusD family nutrient uptake outer membrane protein [Paludibacter sp.]
MKRFINIVLLSLITLAIPSCSDWLGVEPEDGVTRQEYWKTKEEVKSALNGCYASMIDDNMMLSYLLWGEMRADFVAPSSKATAEIIAIRNGEIVASNNYVKWEYLYTTINQCNTVIELAPLALKIDLSFSEKLMKQYQAEAVCVRSLMYFYLLRTFRDAPYVVKASIYDDQNYTPAKMPQAELLEHLVADLQSVENDLPFSYNTLVESKGRFTRWGLKALLADIYLWKQDYAACNELCTQIIESGQFSLLSVRRDQGTALDDNGETVPVYFANKNNVNELFYKMYVEGNSTESIFELQFGTDKSNPMVKWLQPISGYLVAKTDELGKFYPRSDLDNQWRDIRTDFAWKSESVWKWIGLSANGAIYRSTNSSYCNWIFYRLADIMLMKAEALTQQAIATNDQNKLTAALALVQTIRDRSNATETSSYNYLYGSENAALSSKSMEEFILNERARELAFEGKRWFDIVRYVERDNYRNLAYMSQLAIRSTIPEKVSILQKKWLNNMGSHYLPIYIEEIRMNKNLEQNEFYK